MRVGLLASAWLCAVAGCDGAPSRLYGEVHVHQFRGGVHPAALFVATPVAAAAVRDDSVLPSALLPSRVEGSCQLILPAPCGAPCASGPTLADAGVVHIDGGRGLGAVELGLTGDEYLPEPSLPPGASIFAGGERLRIHGDGGSAPAFAGELRAPLPLELTAPSTLALTGGLRVEWKPDRAMRLRLSLVVSSSDGRYAIVRCDAPDPPGAFTFPPSLMSSFPEPPRDLSLEVWREEIVRAPARGDEGVLLHAAWQLKLEAHEDR
jgi:hypothetical protein